jgi:hypothetical protein
LAGIFHFYLFINDIGKLFCVITPNKISSSQIFVSLPEKFWADCVMVVLLPQENTPPRPPQPQKLLSRKQLASLAAAWRLFRDVATNKSHVSSVKRVIKKLLYLIFLLFLLTHPTSSVSKKSGVMTLLIMTVVSENDCWGLVRACSH